ncbi:FHA domain-containing protein [Paenibacillus sp. TRM 82003]|nr:FHA domain-containing protein [Paenibacillus sp. TRM 82003]
MEGTELDIFACLYVIRGEPYRSGACVNLSAEETVAGRSSDQAIPELTFTNPFISRRHLSIRKENDRAVLYDLGSRHGTELNGVRLAPHTPYALKNFDTIRLAKGMTVLHFSYRFVDHTLEIEPLSATLQMDVPAPATTIAWEKRECVVEGERIPMSEKEYRLLYALHEQADRLVSLDEIKSKVWPERSAGAGDVPDVSLDEVNALIYRIRKKYGKGTFAISAVRGSGYMLET